MLLSLLLELNGIDCHVKTKSDNYKLTRKLVSETHLDITSQNPVGDK